MKIRDTEVDTEEDREYEILKYAISYLLSNLDDDIVEDLSDYIGDTTYEELENTIIDLVESYKKKEGQSNGTQ